MIGEAKAKVETEGCKLNPHIYSTLTLISTLDL